MYNYAIRPLEIHLDPRFFGTRTYTPVSPIGHHHHDCEHGYEKFEEWGDECGNDNQCCGEDCGHHEHCCHHDDHHHDEGCHGHHCCDHHKCEEGGDDDDR